MIELTKEQQHCVSTVSNLIGQRQQVITITGRAGTGKTTIVDFIIKEAGVKSPAFAAYTGKAALVMKRKGNNNARTIHSLIYQTRYDPKTDRYYSTKKSQLDDPHTDLIVIDEASMCSDEIIEDIKSFGVTVLLVGDPAQVPPVTGKMNKYVTNPDYHLEKILRQAEGSGIISFSDQIYRLGDLYWRGESPQVRAHKVTDLSMGMLLWADQVLCGTNAVKDSLNRQIREQKGFTSEIPEIGDKVICLKNYSLFSENGTQLVNGMTGYITEISGIEDKNSIAPYAYATFVADYDKSVSYNIKLDLAPFYGHAPFVNRTGKPNLDRHHFDFGYAITVHKSQGSEWEKVLVYSNDFFGDMKKLGYTAATRASQKLVWIQ